MIKANELISGNIALTCKPEFVGTERESFVLTKISSAMIADVEDGKLLIKPIPLTEEWLVKFGISSTDKIRIEIFNDSYKVSMTLDGKDVVVLFRGRYVHTFQNQWFAFTGEELTIKPPSPPKDRKLKPWQ